MKLRSIFKNKSILVGSIIVFVCLFGAIMAPVITKYDPDQMEMSKKLESPSQEHLLGTDQYGRDLFTRIVYGARVSLTVGIISVGIALIIGVTLGLISGYYGGRIDTIIMRIVDIFLSFPVILLAIAFVAALGPSMLNVMIALGLVYWTNYARIVRSSVLSVKEEEYVLVAKTLGASNFRIIIQHILPNVMAPIIVVATLGLGTAIVAESALSFLGLGVQPPQSSWGWTLSFGIQFMHDAPHLSVFPGISIMLTVLGFNLLGDGIRDYIDPKS